MATGMLDHSAGVAVACGAELVVFHPGFLLGREREAALEAVADQLGSLRERLEGKGRAVPFGVEIMGRVRDLGTARRRDLARRARRLGAAGARLRPPARDLGRRVPGGRALRRGAGEGRRGAGAGRPLPRPLLDIAFANRNETKHLPYGEGTLRAEPLAEALARFDRPATVISESPDEESARRSRRSCWRPRRSRRRCPGPERRRFQPCAGAWASGAQGGAGTRRR